MENLLLDLRYALRVLRKSPAFTLVAVVTLMFGIGANVVVFGVLNAVVLQPLDVRDPQGLYQLRNQRWVIGHLLTTSYPAFEDFRQRNTAFSGITAINAYSHGILNWHNTAIGISGDEVTGNYFDLLGIQPEAGQLFHEAAEHGPNSAPYIVLSDGLWRSAFHADPSVIGTTVEFDKRPWTIIGVAAARFHGTERFVWPDYWIPMMNEQQVQGGDYLHDRAHVSVMVIGRLKPGVTEQQATENLNAISAGLAKEFPETDDGQPLRLIHPGLFGDAGNVIRDFLWSITFLALLVLAAACANLASLFAARAADRSREFALRTALGSSRQRLAKQLLAEAAVLSLIGGAAGFATANMLLRALNQWRFWRTSGGDRKCAPVLRRSCIHPHEFPVIRNASCAPGVAQHSVTNHQGRGHGFHVPAALCPARFIVGRADRHLHSACDIFIRGRAQYGAHAAHAAWFSASGCDARSDGPGRICGPRRRDPRKRKRNY
jgi:predicted permease